jgi:lambda family phage minor tail protein L
VSDSFYLYTLDVTPIGGSVYYFHEYNADSVSFNGNIHEPMPIETDGFEISSKGLPTPTIKVSNILGLIGSLVRAYDGLQGAIVKRHTLNKQADGHLYTTADVIGNVEIYYIDRPTGHTSISISFELKSIFDINSMKLPKRTLLQSCSLVYGGSQCGIPITALYPTCPRTVAACAVRADYYYNEANAELPFGGFTGINKFAS